jgi:hypothetical protein
MVAGKLLRSAQTRADNVQHRVVRGSRTASVLRVSMDTEGCETCSRRACSRNSTGHNANTSTLDSLETQRSQKESNSSQGSNTNRFHPNPSKSHTLNQNGGNDCLVGNIIA